MSQQQHIPSGDDDSQNNHNLSESVGSFNELLQQRNNTDTPNKYEDCDEPPYEAIAFLSPKVSELLKEEALVLDDVLDTSAWSDDSDGDDEYKESKLRKNKRVYDDEDGMNEELAGLEAAGLSLQEELALAANGFADFYGDERDDEANSIEESTAEENDRGDWEDSIHEYYKSNNMHNANLESSIGDTGSNSNNDTQQQLPSKLKLSYSLADHAATLDVGRKLSDRGLYTKPLLSRNEVETLELVTLPSWIARPGVEENSSVNNTSRGREVYMNRILSCITEYIEPPRPKTLRRLFSGWIPGPGERRPEDEGGGRGRSDGDEDSRLVTAYSPHKSSHENDDDDDENDDFGDVRSRSRSQQQIIMEPLPVRTVTARIRPDVLCGAVMDAVTTTVEKSGGEITKRQGGHLRAIIPGRRIRVWMPGEWEKEQSKIDETGEERQADSDAHSVVSMLSSMTFSSPSRKPKSKRPTFKALPPYLVDAQLVTKKLGKECERVLLIRVYRVQDVAQQRSDDQEELLDIPDPLDHTSVVDFMGNGSRIDLELESRRSVSALQDAAALVQRLKAVGGEGYAIDQPQPMLNPLDELENESVTSNVSTATYLKSFGDAITSPIRYMSGSSVAPLLTSPPPSESSARTVMGIMTVKLRKKCQASSSVATYSKTEKTHGLYPCLAKDDAPYIQSSWIFLKACIEELDQRCLGYTTLGIHQLFQSPSLPQFDVHYIAQIKSFCRESMIISLVKAASELEVYAREQEVSCGNLDHLLRPTFDTYKLAPPPLPKPVPLTAYPLDFQPPEELSPPWGPEVKKALDKISHESTTQGSGDNSTRLSSFELAKQAVSLLVAAFQRQLDVEQGSRLGRKNMQCMDRLAKMQAHKRNSILKIRDSYGSNLLATNAADEYHLLKQKSSNGASSDTIHAIPDQVPLLLCNVLVGNAAGVCFVTSSHILFHTQLVPIIGGERVHLFSIKDVELTINPPSKSMLSPLPASISLTTSISRSKATREELYNFIPSIGARRFAKFLEVVRDVQVENPDTLKLTERGGLIYMYDEPK